ncbi:MAG: undecaprenyl diphosphate synthase family protein [Betaproteobacteria bacterium]
MTGFDLKLARVPRHVGFIPDGNRRWAQARGAAKRTGYFAGVAPGLRLLDLCRELGIREVSIYGFTRENVLRPADQVADFRKACVDFSQRAIGAGAALRVFGDTASPVFPPELAGAARARSAGEPRVNLLVNYGWKWDLAALGRSGALATEEVPRVELVVRWGGRRRLSGFLPIQCAYADIYVLDTLWPDMTAQEFIDAVHWYQRQDVTLGG